MHSGGAFESSETLSERIFVKKTLNEVTKLSSDFHIAASRKRRN